MKTTEVLSELKRRFPNEPEYHQAVEEVLSTIEDVYNEHPEFDRYNLIERLCIPDRMFSFRVTWVDDKGQVHTNMGYRIQHNNAIGPYKGGIRFHSSVNPSILKFLDYFTYGRRKRRIGFHPQRKIGHGNHAILPSIRYRTLAAYRPRYRRTRR